MSQFLSDWWFLILLSLTFSFYGAALEVGKSKKIEIIKIFLSLFLGSMIVFAMLTEWRGCTSYKYNTTEYDVESATDVDEQLDIDDQCFDRQGSYSC